MIMANYAWTTEETKALIAIWGQAKVQSEPDSQRSIPTRVSRFILIIAQNGRGICAIAQRAERAQSAVWTQFNLDNSR